MIQINLAESERGVEVFMTSIDETAPTQTEMSLAGLMLDAANIKVDAMTVDFNKNDAMKSNAELKAQFNRNRFTVVDGEKQ